MIRRPKSLASIEKAPGPNSPRAAVTTTDTLTCSASVRVSPHKQIISIKQQRVQEAGVNSPTQMSAARATMPTKCQIEPGISPLGNSNVTSMTATEIRSSRSPKPGAPAGNIENSLSTKRPYFWINRGANLD